VIASYTGRAELRAEDREPVKVMVHVEVRRLERFGLDVHGGWAGQITAGCDVRDLVGEKVEIRLPNGRSGQVSVVDSGGSFAGVGEPPL
jgi:hypothetical protein